MELFEPVYGFGEPLVIERVPFTIVGVTGDVIPDEDGDDLAVELIRHLGGATQELKGHRTQLA